MGQGVSIINPALSLPYYNQSRMKRRICADKTLLGMAVAHDIYFLQIRMHAARFREAV